MLRAVTDLLATPMLLIGDAGRLCFANRAASDQLDSCVGLCLTDEGQVEAVDHSHREAWKSGLADARLGARVLLHWRLGAAPFSASLCALPPKPGDTPGTQVLVLMGAGSSAELDVQGFALAHRLSAAETRVVARIARGESYRDVAAALGVTLATVRSQALSIRRKTGHRSAQDLQVALADLPPLRAARQGE